MPGAQLSARRAAGVVDSPAGRGLGQPAWEGRGGPWGTHPRVDADKCTPQPTRQWRASGHLRDLALGVILRRGESRQAHLWLFWGRACVVRGRGRVGSLVGSHSSASVDERGKRPLSCRGLSETWAAVRCREALGGQGGQARFIGAWGLGQWERRWGRRPGSPFSGKFWPALRSQDIQALFLEASLPCPSLTPG